VNLRNFVNATISDSKQKMGDFPNFLHLLVTRRRQRLRELPGLAPAEGIHPVGERLAKPCLTIDALLSAAIKEAGFPARGPLPHTDSAGGRQKNFAPPGQPDD